MHPLDHAVGFQQKQPAIVRRGHHRAVVARTGDDVGTRLQPRRELRDQPVLAQFAAANPSFGGLAQFHCGIRLGKASALRERKLKSACIVIETRMEPLHS